MYVNWKFRKKYVKFEFLSQKNLFLGQKVWKFCKQGFPNVRKFRKLFYSEISENYKKMTLNSNFGNRKKNSFRLESSVKSSECRALLSGEQSHPLLKKAYTYLKDAYLTFIKTRNTHRDKPSACVKERAREKVCARVCPKVFKLVCFTVSSLIWMS